MNSEISNHLSEILNESIKIVTEKKITINIEIAPDYESIKIEPWQPFLYHCPYEGRQTLNETDMRKN